MIIGFSGPKGCGKDLAYQIIKQNRPNVKIEKIAFADPIKQFLSFLLNIDLDTYDKLKRVNNLSLVDSDTNETLTTIPGRQLVREIGMKMRDYDEEQFNRYVFEQVINNPEVVYICTDVRFTNEVELIKNQCYGDIVLIERQGYNYDNHVTETKIEYYDYKIVNDDLQSYTESVLTTFDKIVDSKSTNEFKLEYC